MMLAVGFASYRSSGSILRAICVGAFASFVATFFLIRVDKKSSKRLEMLQLPDRNYPARIYATGIVDGLSNDVITACMDAIQGLPNFGAIIRYEPGEFVLAKTRRSVISWGEKITIKAEPVRGGTRLHVKSAPVLWTVTEDMQCNFQNVALILRDIHRAFPIRDLQPREYFAEVLTSTVR